MLRFSDVLLYGAQRLVSIALCPPAVIGARGVVGVAPSILERSVLRVHARRRLSQLRGCPGHTRCPVRGRMSRVGGDVLV